MLHACLSTRQFNVTAISKPLPDEYVKISKYSNHLWRNSIAGLPGPVSEVSLLSLELHSLWTMFRPDTALLMSATKAQRERDSWPELESRALICND